MQFSKIDITVDSVVYTLNPYDRGQDGAFVYRNAGTPLYPLRAVVKTAVNDLTSDKYVVQLNQPRVCEVTAPGTDCIVNQLQGTDIAKTELRFLATTKPAQRSLLIDQQIALLEEMKSTISNRDVIYS